MVQSPTVRLGKPEIVESFDLYNVDGISLYLKKGIKVRNDRLHIFLRKFLFVKDLAVDGISIDY